MNAHTRKTLAAITGHPAPRDLEWTRFVTLWQDLADEVEQESGDRLAVRMNGHREVFHRPHDGRVSVGAIEQARKLLADHPELQGTGSLFAVAMDAERARILDFDLAATGVQDTERDVRNPDPAARHLRTVERHTGHDDHQVYLRYFDELAAALTEEIGARRFVILGHGTGKSDVAEDFVLRLQEKDPALADRIAGVGVLDLSAAGDADIEAAAQRVIRQSQ